MHTSSEWEQHLQFDIPYNHYETFMKSILRGGDMPSELSSLGVKPLGTDESVIIKGSNEYDNDVTLREADQVEPLADWQKIRLAGLMVDTGAMPRIEVGFASPGDTIVPKIIQEFGSVDHVRFGALTLAQPGFVDLAGDYLKKAKKSCIHIFFPSHPAHAAMEVTTSSERSSGILPSVSEVVRRSIDKIVPSITRARSYTDSIEFSPEIGVDTDPVTLVNFVREAVKVGATIINVPGTRGDGPPEYRETLFRFLHFATRDLQTIHPHVFTSHEHGDFGTQLEAAVQAQRGGSAGAETTCGKYGEGGGNVDKVELYGQRIMGRYPGEFDIDIHQKLLRMREFVIACIGNPPPLSFTPKPHGAGVHESREGKYRQFMSITGNAPDRRFYRAANGLAPEQPTVKKIGKLSGRNALVDMLHEFGISTTKEDKVIIRIDRELGELAQVVKSLSPYNVLAAYLRVRGDLDVSWEGPECIVVKKGTGENYYIGSKIGVPPGIDWFHPCIPIMVPSLSDMNNPASQVDHTRGPLHKTILMLEHYLGINISMIEDRSRAEFDQQAAETQFPDLFKASGISHSIESSRRIGDVIIEIDGARRTARTAHTDSDKAICEAIIIACIDLIWGKAKE